MTMSDYDEVRRRLDAAVAARDRLEAEWELDAMKQLVAELEADRFVRDLEAWGRIE